MSTPQQPGTPRPRGAHRAESQPSRSLLLPLLGVLAVLAALGLAGYMLLTSGDGDEDPTTNPRPTLTETVDETVEPTDEPSKEPTKEPSKEPTKDNNGGNTGGTNGGSNGGGGNQKEPGAPIPQIPVYVFNQTPVTGLAAQTASSFESAGWNVAGVDNWIGTVPEDTVYYYPGDIDAAERLSADFPDISRVWPASSPMPGGGLTVILADTERK